MTVTVHALFRSAHYLSQEGGICLMRTMSLSDAASWRAWDGQDFAITTLLIPIYPKSMILAGISVCHLKTSLPWNMGGIGYVTQRAVHLC